MYNIHIVRYCPQIHVKLEFFLLAELLRSLHLVTLAQHKPECRNFVDTKKSKSRRITKSFRVNYERNTRQT